MTRATVPTVWSAQGWATVADPPPLRHHAAIALPRVAATVTLLANAPAAGGDGHPVDDALQRLADRVVLATLPPTAARALRVQLHVTDLGTAALGVEAAVVAAAISASAAAARDLAPDHAVPSRDAIVLEVLPPRGAPAVLHQVAAAQRGGLVIVGQRHPAVLVPVSVPADIAVVVAWPAAAAALGKQTRTTAAQLHSFRALQIAGQAGAAVAAWVTGNLAALQALEDDPFLGAELPAMVGWPAAAQTARAQGAALVWPVPHAPAWVACCPRDRAPHVAWALQQTAWAHALAWEVLWDRVAPLRRDADTSTPDPTPLLPLAAAAASS